jgi:hypothetical protein
MVTEQVGDNTSTFLVLHQFEEKNIVQDLNYYGTQTMVSIFATCT